MNMLPLPQRAVPDDPSANVAESDFAVDGMTCASCAARVERSLQHAPGVRRATVNYATGRATVAFAADQVSVDDLVATVEHTGYHLSPIAAADLTPPDDAADEQRFWLRRVVVAWPLS